MLLGTLGVSLLRNRKRLTGKGTTRAPRRQATSRERPLKVP